MKTIISFSAYLTICGLAVTLTFNLLISKFLHFICVSSCTVSCEYR